MKTNHSRDFIARKDLNPGARVCYKSGYKATANSLLRAAERRVLQGFRVGSVDPEEAVFPLLNEVEDVWNWD